jgi:hypothetical protein
MCIEDVADTSSGPHWEQSSLSREHLIRQRTNLPPLTKPKGLLPYTCITWDIVLHSPPRANQHCGGTSSGLEAKRIKKPALKRHAPLFVTGGVRMSSQILHWRWSLSWARLALVIPSNKIQAVTTLKTVCLSMEDDGLKGLMLTCVQRRQGTVPQNGQHVWIHVAQPRSQLQDHMREAPYDLCVASSCPQTCVQLPSYPPWSSAQYNQTCGHISALT